MSGTPVIAPILATPFGIASLEGGQELNAQLAPRFSAAAAKSPDPICYRSRDDLYDQQDAPIAKLRDGVIAEVVNFVAAVNEFTTWPDLTLQARAWFTVVRTNGAVSAAMYPLTSWCVVYCVAAPPASSSRADSGALRLYESRLATMFQDASNADMRMPFKAAHYAWRPVPGSLAIFPASLTHEIALLRSEGELILVTSRVRFVAAGQEGFERW